MLTVSANARERVTEYPGMSLKQRLDAFLAGVEAQAYRLAMAQLRDRDAALDAVQDAMMRLVQKYSHKPEKQWAPLFFRILRNRVMDDLRQRGRFVDIEVPEDAAPDAPDDQLAQREAIGALQQALDKLPQRQREAVLLRVWEGHDVADTAALMGCGQGSVKTHLSRAMKALRLSVEGLL